jgi:hypothetical protein
MQVLGMSVRRAMVMMMSKATSQAVGLMLMPHCLAIALHHCQTGMRISMTIVYTVSFRDRVIKYYSSFTKKGFESQYMLDYQPCCVGQGRVQQAPRITSRQQAGLALAN